MADSIPPKPELRSLLVRLLPSGSLESRLVLFEDVHTWRPYGWMFVANDPDDEADLAQWLTIYKALK